MTENRRAEFMNRLSTVGIGTRESLQVLLAGILYDLRDQISQGRISEEEVDTAITFHDEVETLWRDSTATNPPIAPGTLHHELCRISNLATGAMAQFQRKLERACEDAEKFKTEHESR